MIRQAKKSDVLEIESLIRLGAKTGRVLSRSGEEIINSIQSFFVYTKDGTIVGCCALDIYSKKLAEIRSLVVSPKFQREGIGSKLIETCIRKAEKLGIYQVLAVTDRQKLFELVGFKSKLNNKQPLFINLKSYD